jgi:UbiD family decarboxylase
MYKDLREFIELVDKLGGLRRIEGVDPCFEIGAITEVAAGRPDGPALLFDGLKGFPRGFRIFTNATTSPQRAALALGIDPGLRPLDALKAWMEKRKTLQPRAPVVVKDAAFLQHTVRGKDVDLAKFPAPIWHRHDGGPFIGSGSIVIMRDPDGGWINASIYRVQVHGRNKVTVQFDHGGRHGAIIAKKYWEQGKPCPLAVVNGEDPVLFVAGFEYLPAGQSEYEFAGAIKGAPIEVHPGPLTGLPVPAHAEIVFEGHLLPMSETTLPEGPFGEFTGYYASQARPAPVMDVSAVHHRSDPILLGSPPMKPRSSSATMAMPSGPPSSPRPTATWRVWSSSWTRMSIRPVSTTSCGRWRRVANRRSKSTSSATPGARRSIRAFRRTTSRAASPRIRK